MERNYFTFKQAEDFVHRLGLRTAAEWNAYCKSGKRPHGIPFNPNRVYKSEWKGWGDWLGTGNISNANKTFRTFEESREFVRSLAFKNREEWEKWCKSGNKPPDIPSHPHQVYKDKGWKGFGDWLGTGTVAPQNKKFLVFQEARKYVHSLGLKGYEHWIEYCKSGTKPDNIPVSPHVVYKDSWKSWGDWLGYQFSSYEKNQNEPKQKLTLSLSKETIQRAKSININLSALTENLLNTLTYEPMNGIEEKKVVESYDTFIEAVRPLLKKYGAKVEVGLQLHNALEPNSNRSSLGFPIQLDDSGLTLLINNSPQRVSVVDVMHNLYNPTTILKNVIVAVSQASETNQEKIRELQLALRFANAIFEGSDS